MLRSLFQNLALSCHEAARLQSAALDRSLGFGPRLGLRLHLVLCKWCRRYGKHINFLRTMAQHPEAHEKASAAQILPLAARDRIKRRLHEEQKK